MSRIVDIRDFIKEEQDNRSKLKCHSRSHRRRSKSASKKSCADISENSYAEAVDDFVKIGTKLCEEKYEDIKEREKAIEILREVARTIYC